MSALTKHERDWIQFFDVTIPNFIKKKVFEGKPWANEVFSEKDFLFFERSVCDLSAQFTNARGNKLPRYFDEERFRTAYLLYWFPLQAAKFRKIFERHQKHFESLLKGKSVLKVLDLGSGPGTASFALKLFINSLPFIKPVKIEFTWVDRDPNVLELGKQLATTLGLNPKTVLCEWTRYKPESEFDLILVGSLLNETESSELFQILRAPEWIIVEPAIQTVSQRLAALREKAILKNELHVIGPCLHEGACPLKIGKNWCHFSFLHPLQGHWFKQFSKSLGSERDWMKLSYLWLSRKKQLHPRALQLVVSDPLREKTGGQSVLLCNPKRVRRYPLKPQERYYRGDLVQTDK